MKSQLKTVTIVVLAKRSRAQQSTMGKKVWLSMQPKNFGSDKIVRPSVRTSTPLCKMGCNFAFQAFRAFRVYK